jgi:hypothetical protein
VNVQVGGVGMVGCSVYLNGAKRVGRAGSTNGHSWSIHILFQSYTISMPVCDAGL